MFVLVVGFFNTVVHCHRPTWTVSILAAAPIGDVLVIVASDLVVPIAVEYERSSTSLSGNKCYSGHLCLLCVCLLWLGFGVNCNCCLLFLCLARLGLLAYLCGVASIGVAFDG